MEKKNQYATMDSVLPGKILHKRGTIERSGKLEFWLSQPCPRGVSIDEWEEIQQAKWERIFGKKETV